MRCNCLSGVRVLFNLVSFIASTVAPTFAYSFDSQGNQYISDTLNNCVRKIDTSGSISTLIGLAISGSGDTCSTSSNSTPTPSQGLYQPTAGDGKHFNHRYCSSHASRTADAQSLQHLLRARQKTSSPRRQ